MVRNTIAPWGGALRAGLGLLALAAGPAAVGTARAETVNLAPYQDNTLIEDAAGALSNGAGAALFVGRNNQSIGSIRRAILAFDTASSIPSGSIVRSVTLRMRLAQNAGGASRVSLHRLRAGWGEGTSASTGGGGAPATTGDATWLHTFYATEFWDAPGGDFDQSESAATDVDLPADYTWGPADPLTADVQAWVDDPDSNFGWIMLGDEATPQNAKRFESRESADEALRPDLTIEFDPPCTAGAAAGHGWWHRQCLGLSLADGGLDPGAGSGPLEPLQPGFADTVLPCADGMLERLGLPGTAACEAIDADPAHDCRERALRRLASLVLDVCSGRVQTSCPARSVAPACPRGTVGSIIDELAAAIAGGECPRLSSCGAGNQ